MVTGKLNKRLLILTGFFFCKQTEERSTQYLNWLWFSSHCNPYVSTFISNPSQCTISGAATLNTKSQIWHSSHSYHIVEEWQGLLNKEDRSLLIWGTIWAQNKSILIAIYKTSKQFSTISVLSDTKLKKMRVQKAALWVAAGDHLHHETKSENTTTFISYSFTRLCLIYLAFKCTIKPTLSQFYIKFMLFRKLLSSENQEIRMQKYHHVAVDTVQSY